MAGAWNAARSFTSMIRGATIRRVRAGVGAVGIAAHGRTSITPIGSQRTTRGIFGDETGPMSERGLMVEKSRCEHIIMRGPRRGERCDQVAEGKYHWTANQWVAGTDARYLCEEHRPHHYDHAVGCPHCGAIIPVF